ncbi:hypothetical protein [Carbonactinospora thermoautotrophica]|uniref:hypothetical protein n=1 Tax=Carbonactinospora thermoautotrophica TaxID=1469144 RepID=UPI00226E9C3F|nr:hypothetical protein [Carbonactinospora thermoautotrophica]
MSLNVLVFLFGHPDAVARPRRAAVLAGVQDIHADASGGAATGTGPRLAAPLKRLQLRRALGRLALRRDHVLRHRSGARAGTVPTLARGPRAACAMVSP